MHYRPGVEAAPGYKLISLLGRGGFGEVWKAEGPGKVTRAIKIIDKVDEKAGRKEFRALNLIKNIIHPNLVTISGFWLRDADGNLVDPKNLSDENEPDDDRPTQLIVAMDLGEMTLLERLEECRKNYDDATPGGIPVEELLEYTEATAKAIDYLNIRHDVQHRDIKPQNILIVGGSAKVCDYGLASTVSAIRTSMGGAGSLAYMAPEVYCTKRPSRTTDQYSLAIAYAELRTGRLPLTDMESYAVLDDAKRHGNLDFSWLDEAERAIIAKAAAIDPDDRYERCIDMVRALRDACGGGPAVAASAVAIESIGDYDVNSQVYRRGGEQIYDATGPEGHRVLLVVRDLSKTNDTVDFATLNLIRNVSRQHEHLAEMYECDRLNAEGQVLPSRLFDLPNAPAPAKAMVVSRFVQENLSQRMAEGGIETHTLLGYMDQLAEAVDFLNAPNHPGPEGDVSIIHGHLRPVNLLIEDDQVYISNFAIARTLSGDECEFLEGKKRPDSPYLPPECATGRLTRWTDQYLLAVAYLQMRTGKPSSGLTGATRSSRRSAGHYLLDLSSLHDEERKVIERATDVTPNNRYGSCQEMVESLHAAWETILPETSPEAMASSAATAETPSASANEPTLADPCETDVISLVDSDRTQVLQEAPLDGTLVPPLSETRLSSDTDRAELASATTKRPKPPSETASPKPPALRPIWQRPAIVGSFAVMVAVVVAGFFVRHSSEGRRDPDPIGNGNHRGTVDSQRTLREMVVERIKQQKYLEAMAAIDQAAVEHSGRTDLVEQTELRRLVARRWYDQQVETKITNREFAAALDEPDDVTIEWFTILEKPGWRDDLYDTWNVHAQDLQDKQDHQSAVEQWNRLLRHKKESHDNVESQRIESLRAMLATARNQIAGDQIKDDEGNWQAARDGFEAIKRSIEDAAKTPVPLKEKDFDEMMRQARLGRARAYARNNDWKSVSSDLPESETGFRELREKYPDWKDRNHFELLYLKANDAIAESAKKLNLGDKLKRARNLGPMDPWEQKQYREWIKDWEKRHQSISRDKNFKEFVDQIAIAKEHVLDRKYKLARTTLVGIKRKSEFAKFLTDGSRDFYKLKCIATLGDAESKPVEVKEQVEHWTNHVPSDAPLVVRLSEVLLYRLGQRDDRTASRSDLPRAIDALSMISKAKTRLAGKSKNDLTEIQKKMGLFFLDDLRAMRDEATPQNDSFKTLAEVCDQFESMTTKPLPLLTACRAESSLALGQPVDKGIFSLKPSGKPTDSDNQYVDFVKAIARLYDANPKNPDPKDANPKDLQASAKLMKKVYKAYLSKGADRKNAWQDKPDRKKQAAMILYHAGLGLAKKEGREDALDHQRYQDPDATTAFGYLNLTKQLLPSGKPAAQSDSEIDLHELEVHRALAAAYSKDFATEAILLTDPLVDRWVAKLPKSGPPTDDSDTSKMSPHVLLENFRLHQAAWTKAPKKDQNHWERATVALDVLFRIRVERSFKYDFVFEHVIEPGYRLSGDVLSGEGYLRAPQPAVAARQAAARICAARGRYIGEYPKIERQFSDSVPEQEIYDSFHRAIIFDDSLPEYFLSRALAAYDHPYLPANKKVEQLIANALVIEKIAPADKKQTAIATGLRGLASWQRATLKTDFGAKMIDLKEANQKLRVTIDQGDLGDEEQQRFLLILGDVYIYQASYSRKRTAQQDYLDKAEWCAKEIDAKFSVGEHPQRLYGLWGNTLETRSRLAKDSKGYCTNTDGYRESIPKFTKQLTKSEEKENRKAQANALRNRGRACYRWASAIRLRARYERDSAAKELLKTDQTRSPADTQSLQASFDKKQQAFEEAEKESNKLLNDAVRDLEEVTKSDEAAKLTQAEANRWLGEIYHPDLLNNPTEAKDRLGKAVRIAKEKEKPIWALYQSRRVEGRIAFARCYSSDPDDHNYDKELLKAYVMDAETYAKDLLDENQPEAIESRIPLRHRISAALSVVEGQLLLRNVPGADKAYMQLQESQSFSKDKLFDLHYGMIRQLYKSSESGTKKRELTKREQVLVKKAFSSGVPLWKDASLDVRTNFFQLNERFMESFGNLLQKAVKRKDDAQAKLSIVNRIIERLEDQKTMLADKKWIDFVKSQPKGNDWLKKYNNKTSAFLKYYLGKRKSLEAEIRTQQSNKK